MKNPFTSCLAAILLLMGLFLSHGATAQVSSTLISANNPKSGIQWKSDAEGKQIVLQQIANYETSILALTQQGADPVVISKEKARKQYYELILQGLNGGQSLGTAVPFAFGTMGGGTDAGSQSALDSQELQDLYDISIGKLSL
jgi:broad specificity polyphosphatase/5'/3'-nucleotidase SurE